MAVKNEVKQKGEKGNKKKRVKRIVTLESLKPLSKVINKLELKKLRANMVYTGRVVNIYVPENGNKAIEIENSWIELCLFLLGYLDMKTEHKMLRVLVEKKVLNDKFSITSAPTISLEATHKQTYHIPGTRQYLVLVNNPFIMLEAIKKIVSAIGIEQDEFRLDVVPMNESELAARLSTGDTILCTKQLDIEDANRLIKEKAKIESISVDGIYNEVSSFTEAVEFIMMYICNNYTEYEIKQAMVCNMAEVGISDTAELNGVETSIIENTELYLYLSHDSYKFIEYIYKISKFLMIDAIVVEIKQEYFIS